jgi:hypothetical protein
MIRHAETKAGAFRGLPRGGEGRGARLPTTGGKESGERTEIAREAGERPIIYLNETGMI